MSHSITIFPYSPFNISSGLTLLNFQNKDEFSQLIFRINKLKNHDTLTDDDNRIIHFYTDTDNPIDEHLKDISIIGDLCSFDLNNSTQLKTVIKKVLTDSIVLQTEIDTINSELNGIIFDAIAKYSLPLDSDSFSDFEKILKAKGVHIDASNWMNYCDKIMDIVSFYSEFTTKKLLVFNNLERLLNLNQLNEINNYLKSVNLMIVSFESYPMSLKEKGLDIKVYSIDNDHVRFDY